MRTRRKPPAPDPARPSAVEEVVRLLHVASERGASDLHLDPEESGVRVRLRTDGVLVDLPRLHASLHPTLVGRLKSLAGLLAYRTDVPQEGRITAERSPLGREVRVSTYPTVLGERVAVRLDTASSRLPGLHDLGLPSDVATSLRSALARPDGLILLTGPSGSGKTTTLYACLRELVEHDSGRGLVSVEDPVERRVAGVTQTEVNRTAGLTFPRALRSILRHDPDVILVGEVRDRETAAVALEAGLTGHLVASTVHAGTAAAVFARLLEMGAEPFVLNTAVRGVLAQRLLRRACTQCAGVGCEECGDTGYAGRILAAEWLSVGTALRQAIAARQDGGALEAAAREDGATTLADHARDLVERGLTTIEEVRRVLGSI